MDWYRLVGGAGSEPFDTALPHPTSYYSPNEKERRYSHTYMHVHVRKNTQSSENPALKLDAHLILIKYSLTLRWSKTDVSTYNIVYVHVDMSMYMYIVNVYTCIHVRTLVVLSTILVHVYTYYNFIW